MKYSNSRDSGLGHKTVSAFISRGTGENSANGSDLGSGVAADSLIF